MDMMLEHIQGAYMTAFIRLTGSIPNGYGGRWYSVEAFRRTWLGRDLEEETNLVSFHVTTTAKISKTV